MNQLTFSLSALLLTLLSAAAASATAPRVELADLDGSDGAIVRNDTTTDPFPGSLLLAGGMIGDVNGDGRGDFAQAGFTGSTFETFGLAIFVVFGTDAGYASPFDLSGLDGSNGFLVTDDAGDLEVITGIEPVGDVNGDGIDDFAVAAEAPGNVVGFVVYGRTGAVLGTVDYADLDAGAGFRIVDSTTRPSGSGFIAFATSPGDVNCDGRSDVVLGSPEAAISGPDTPGAAFVIFGRSGAFPSPLPLASLDGTNGFEVAPPADAVDFGFAVSVLGDFDGDLCDDFAVGDLNAPGEGENGSGQVRVIYGAQSPWPASFAASSLDGSNGFAIRVAEAPNELGVFGVSLDGGDFDGDGFADLLAGAPGGTGGDVTEEGGVVIYRGAAATPASVVISSLGGGRASHTREFLSATSVSGLIGASVAAGDVNGDGLDDVVIGSADEFPDEDTPGGGLVYVVYGRAGGFPPQIDLSNLGAGGLVLAGAESNDGAGALVDAGELTRTGVADLFIGAEGADLPSGSDQDVIYLFYGVTPPLFADGFESGDTSAWSFAVP